jgi:hypothetical protein
VTILSDSALDRGIGPGGASSIRQPAPIGSALRDK